MLRGGYQIVDFKGEALTSGSSKTVSGVYDSINNANGKPTLVSGLKIGDTSYPDVYTLFTKSSANYVGKIYYNGGNIAITVTNASAVTATVNAD